jgi:hypothetical protein
LIDINMPETSHGQSALDGIFSGRRRVAAQKRLLVRSEYAALSYAALSPNVSIVTNVQQC